MKKPIVVTVGNLYSDIDGYACAIAYKELLDLKGEENLLVLEGSLNESVTETVKKWNVKYLDTLPGRSEDYIYAVVDISNPEYLASFIIEDKIHILFDHRSGFESYWDKKLEKKSHIELVGSCATLIWEEFKKEKLDNKVSSESANLLYTAILSNTLNLKSKNTTKRDVTALRQLKKHSTLPKNWDMRYFAEVSSGVFAEPLIAMKNDTKFIDIDNKSFVIVQIELWNSREFITKNLEIIKDYLESFGQEYVFFTSPSISEGINYIISYKENTKNLLTKVISAHFEGNMGKTKSLWLRKEIVRDIRKEME